MNIHNSVSDLIGHTPLLRLCNIEKNHSLRAALIAKVESVNPAGSVKDRVALNMINEAEKSGTLTKNTVIIEPTSGNTGIGLCALAASRGYKVMIVMPDSMSAERQLLMRAYGAELVLTDDVLGMSGAIRKAKELHEAIPDSIIAGQFENPANPAAHYKSTAPEIWNDTDGKIDIFVCGVGTGGTVTGVGRYLKEKNPDIKIVGIEPSGSAVLSGGEAGKHGLQGIGAGFIPDVLDTSFIDEIMTVTENEAYECGREIARCEGLLVGISSGAALSAAIKLAGRDENRGKNIVVLLPDTGDRYLSTEMFSSKNK